MLGRTLARCCRTNGGGDVGGSGRRSEPGPVTELGRRGENKDGNVGLGWRGENKDGNVGLGAASRRQGGASWLEAASRRQGGGPADPNTLAAGRAFEVGGSEDPRRNRAWPSKIPTVGRRTTVGARRQVGSKGA